MKHRATKKAAAKKAARPRAVSKRPSKHPVSKHSVSKHPDSKRSFSKPSASKAAASPGALAPGAKPARVRAILEKLDEAYPHAECALQHRNAFELLIATILSAQSTDATVNTVTPVLFKTYPSPKDLGYADPRDVEKIIHRTGFFRNKTKSIIGASKKIVEDFSGEVPKTMDQLLTLPGVARKTANVVLGTAYGIAAGVVVDTHVLRLSFRLDLTRHAEPKKVELDLMRIIPQDRWILFSHQLIWHGRRVCIARKPRCIDCNLKHICYSKDKTI